MVKFNPAEASLEVLERESLAWVNRLLSGAVTRDQAEAFRVWRATSSEHADAFAEAMRFQRLARRAIQAQRRDPALTGLSGLSGLSGSRRSRRRPVALNPTRRALLGGAIAASGAGYMVVHPPDHLWSSWSELTSAYRTAAGERRNVAVAGGVSLELNTRTSIARHAIDGIAGVELVSGEAAITAQRPSTSPFTIVAGAGRTTLARGAANIRADGETICVTCLGGSLEIAHPSGRLRLAAGQATTYTRRSLDAPQDVDAGLTTAWRRGLLIFRNAPLQRVVDELNRYRSGRIILADAVLAHRPVYGVFQTSQIAQAVQQVQNLTGARATELPGGVILLT